MPDELRKRKYKKYQLLQTSLKYQTKEFFENSTLHGVRFIAEKGRPVYERLMWFIFVSIGAIVTLIIIASLWEKFQTNPTITGLDTDFHNWDVPFPGISVCPINAVDEKRVEDEVSKKWKDADEKKREFYSGFLFNVGNFSYRGFKNIEKYKSDGTLAKENLKELAYKVLFKCEEVLKDCLWKGEEIDCCKVFKPTFTEKGFCYSFNTRNSEKNWPDKPAGIDDGFKVKEIYETDSKWTVMFHGNVTGLIAYKIFIHDSEELPGLEMAPQHIWTMTTNRIFFTARMTYTTNDTKQLTSKQRKCIFKNEVELKTYPEYSYWACMTDCRMKYALEKCSCVPFFYLQVRKRLTNCMLCCTVIDDCYCLYCKSLFVIETMEKGLNCPCELGCTNTVYEVEKLSDAQEDDEDELEIGFVSWPMMRYKREVLFGWVDLLVSFGGIAGLFLGFSLLSGVEIVYYFTLRAACMVYKDDEKLNEIRTEEKSKIKRTDIDLSLKPKFRKLEGQNEKMSENSYINNVLQVSGQKKALKLPRGYKTPHVPFLN